MTCRINQVLSPGNNDALFSGGILVQQIHKGLAVKEMRVKNYCLFD
jgi:hypothetical protein